MSVAVEFDDFDLFMLRHSLRFREAVNAYLNDETMDGKKPTPEIIDDRVKTLHSFLDYIAGQNGDEEPDE